VTASCEYLDSLAGEVDLDDIAIELDFIASTGRRRGSIPREGGLDAVDGRLSTLQRH